MTVKSECPLAKVREVLHLERNDLAALAGVDYTKIISIETGYFSSIPSGVLSVITPYLKAAGTTPERLQGEFRAWRKGLGAKVAERTAKELKERTAV